MEWPSATVDAMSERVRRSLARLLATGLTERQRNAAALALAAVALMCGAIFSTHRIDLGVTVTEVDGGVVIAWVQPGGLAWQAGAREGARLEHLNAQSPASFAVPSSDIDELGWFIDDPSGNGRAEEDRDYGYVSRWFEQSQLGGAALGPLIALAVLGAAAWWMTSPRSTGSHLSPLILPAAAATAIPLAVTPGPMSLTALGTALGVTLPVLAMLPLADGLAAFVGPLQRRMLVRGTAILAAAVSMWILLASQGSPWARANDFVAGLLVMGMVVVPAIAAARTDSEAGADGAIPSAGAQVVKPTELLVLGLTPAVSYASVDLVADTPQFWPFLLWIVAILAVRRWTVRPLLRVVQRVQLQRDLVVAATEAERARLAADLHDEALQDLTLLVRRLDGAGDREGADMARTIADQLRAICGDLRLPILDDLGAGPALEWLVARVGRLAGGEVRLERIDPLRPPSNVELAVFRVAQEALANAVKHGGTPIVVRYQSTSGRVSLSIDDSGPGIPVGAGEAAQARGRFGLLNMQQRAEQIGGILDVRQWPTGGTRVALDWRAT